jgi:hypothetical protein
MLFSGEHYAKDLIDDENSEIASAEKQQLRGGDHGDTEQENV